MPHLATPHRGTQHQNRNYWSPSEPSPTTPRHAPAGCGAPLTLPRKGRNMRRARRRPRWRCRCSLRRPPSARPGTGTNLDARLRRYWHSGRHPPQRRRHQRPHLCAWYSHQRPHNWCRPYGNRTAIKTRSVIPVTAKQAQVRTAIKTRSVGL